MKMKSPDDMCSDSMEVKPKTLDLMQNYEDPCQSPTTCGAHEQHWFLSFGQLPTMTTQINFLVEYL